MRKRAAATMAVAAAACALLLAACAGGGGEKGAGTIPEATPRAGQTPAAAGQAGQEAPPSSLRQALERWQRGSFKITYAVTIPGFQDPFQVVLYTQPGKVRIDTEDMTVIQREGEPDLVCDRQERTCEEGDAVSALSTSVAFDPKVASSTVDLLAAPGRTAQQSGRTIAGRQATCWSSGTDTRIEACFADDGALLLLAVDYGGRTLAWEAQRVERASDADFRPPYPVTRS
ncbi:MAG TPA: hypothetical protein VNL95_05625 [Dehalococcoidia bacterium]|nr:hypothetical protein [Dehalococcoidia bacterium]